MKFTFEDLFAFQLAVAKLFSASV